MKHPIQQKLNQIESKLKRAEVRYAIAVLLSTSVLMALVTGWLDSQLRFPHGVFRYLCLVTILVSGSALVFVLLRPALFVAKDRIRIALRIEKEVPELKDRLASSIEFLEGNFASNELSTPKNKQRSGSPQLQHSLIDQTEQRLAEIDLDRVVDQGKPMVAILGALFCFAIMATWLIVDSDTSSRAFHRAAFPWKQIDWPKRHQLVFEELPEHVQRNRPIEIIVENRAGRLPKQVFIEFRTTNEPEKISRYETSSSERRAALWFERTSEDFEIRALGGDGRTEWQRVVVRDAPAFVETVFEIVPPNYTGRNRYRSTSEISGIRGSQLSISGKLNRPVSGVELHVLIENETVVQTLPLLSDEGLSFGGTDVHALVGSGMAFLRATDEYGLEGDSEEFPVTCFPDAPPQIQIRHNAYQSLVTTDGTVLINIDVSDDLSVQSADLRIVNDLGVTLFNQELIDDDTTEAMTPQNRDVATLNQGQDISVAIQSNQFTQVGHDRHLFRIEWSPSQTGDVEVGDSFLIEVRATDSFPQQSVSDPVSFRVVSEEEIIGRLGSLETKLSSMLSESLEAHLLATSFVERIQATTLESRDELLLQAQLNGLEYQESRAAEMLNDLNGAGAVISQLAHVVVTNGLEDSALGQRVTQIDFTIGRLSERSLPRLMRDIADWTLALEQATSSTDSNSHEWARLLTSERATTIVEQQNAITQSLEGLLDILGRWQAARGFLDQLLLVRDGESELGRELFRIQRSMNRINQAEPAQDRLALERFLRSIATQQNELARSFERILFDMQSVIEQQGNDPTSLKTGIERALEIERQDAVVGQMRQLADQLNQYRLGLAISQHEEVMSSLSRMIDALREPEDFSDRNIERLESLAEQLNSLLERHSDNRLSFERDVKGNDRSTTIDLTLAIRDASTSLQEELGQVIDAYHSQLPEIALVRLNTARRAFQRLDRELLARAESNLLANQLLDVDLKIEQEFEQIRSELQSVVSIFEEMIQVQEQRSFEQALSNLTESLRDLQAAQSALRQRAEEHLFEGDQPTQISPETLAELMDEQSRLAGHLPNLLEESDAFPSIQLVLQQVRREMERATGLLRRTSSRRQAVAAMLRAEQLLASLLGVVDPESSQDNDTQNDDPGEEEEAPSSPRTVDLRTIRVLQQNILSQTVELEQVRVENGLTRDAEDYRRLAELAELQRLLHQMLQQLKDESLSEIDERATEMDDNSTNRTDPRDQNGLIIPLPGSGDNF